MIDARAFAARVIARLVDRLPAIATTLQDPVNWARFAAMLGAVGVHLGDRIIIGLAGIFWCISIFVLPEVKQQ